MSEQPPSKEAVELANQIREWVKEDVVINTIAMGGISRLLQLIAAHDAALVAELTAAKRVIDDAEKALDYMSANQGFEQDVKRAALAAIQKFKEEV